MIASTKKPRPGLALESLEDRLTPAVTVTLNSAYDLQIVSDNASDHVVVSRIGVAYFVTNHGVTVAGILAGRVLGGDVLFLGNGGNDYFRNDTSLRTHANGGSGNDVLVGGSSSDWLFGGLGDDVLSGRDGSDFLHGEGGRDRFFGGAGYDRAWGGPDTDWAHFDVEWRNMIP